MFRSRWTRTRGTRQIFSKVVKTEKPRTRPRKAGIVRSSKERKD